MARGTRHRRCDPGGLVSTHSHSSMTSTNRSSNSSSSPYGILLNSSHVVRRLSPHGQPLPIIRRPHHQLPCHTKPIGPTRRRRSWTVSSRWPRRTNRCRVRSRRSYEKVQRRPRQTMRSSCVWPTSNGRQRRVQTQQGRHWLGQILARHLQHATHPGNRCSRHQSRPGDKRHRGAVVVQLVTRQLWWSKHRHERQSRWRRLLRRPSHRRLPRFCQPRHMRHHPRQRRQHC